MWNKRSALLLCAFVLFGLCLDVFGEIKIKKLSGTETAEYGTSVVLKCDSSVKNDTGVEVKWFYNGDKQIFIWIPNKNKPQAMGDFQEILEVGEENTIEQDIMHSVIRFKNVTFNMTGDYKCKVSGDVFEDEKTKTMVVYQPASFVELVSEDQESSATLNCSAYELYPQPTITLVGTYISGSNGTVPIKETKQEIIGNQEVFYNVTKTFEVNTKELDGNVEFNCMIFIPNTDYNEVKSFIYESTGYYDETTTEYLDDEYTIGNNDTFTLNDTDSSYSFNDTTSNETSWLLYNDTTTLDTTTSTIATEGDLVQLLGNAGVSWTNPSARWIVLGFILMAVFSGGCC